MDVLEHLVAAALEQQSGDAQKPPTGGVLFRNAWPPDFSEPDQALVYIHQQVCITQRCHALSYVQLLPLPQWEPT